MAAKVVHPSAPARQASYGIKSIKDVTPIPHNGCTSAEASAGLGRGLQASWKESRDVARHTGPVCRLCRRERMKLFLKGDRCFKEKCAIERRAYPPGQHGQRRGRRTSGLRLSSLREKQKVKRIYGIQEQPVP